MTRSINIPARDVRKARIEIIPMIDTIFFLLVFFMYTSLSMVKMSGMGVSLPRGQTHIAKPPAHIVISVDSGGQCFLNTRLIVRSHLKTDLQAEIDDRPNTILVVNVDKSRSVQELISIMDIVNSVQTPLPTNSLETTSPAVSIATSPVNGLGQSTGGTSVIVGRH